MSAAPVKYEIEGFLHTPTGIAVDIQGFGQWGLSAADIRALRDGDHLVEGTWPSEEWADEDWQTEANETLAALMDAEQDVARYEAMREATLGYPGFPTQVYGGWIWYVDGREYFKQRTYEELIKTTYEVVERIGIEEAFDMEVQP